MLTLDGMKLLVNGTFRPPKKEVKVTMTNKCPECIP